MKISHSIYEWLDSLSSGVSSASFSRSATSCSSLFRFSQLSLFSARSHSFQPALPLSVWLSEMLPRSLRFRYKNLFRLRSVYSRGQIIIVNKLVIVTRATNISRFAFSSNGFFTICTSHFINELSLILCEYDKQSVNFSQSLEEKNVVILLSYACSSLLYIFLLSSNFLLFSCLFLAVFLISTSNMIQFLKLIP